jgi:hypothetical protein
MTRLAILALLLAGCGGTTGQDDGGAPDLGTSVCSTSAQCPAGDACRINMCVPDPCADVTCAAAETCDDGQCIPTAGNLCDGAVCPGGNCEILAGAQVCAQ